MNSKETRCFVTTIKLYWTRGPGVGHIIQISAGLILVVGVNFAEFKANSGCRIRGLSLGSRGKLVVPSKHFVTLSEWRLVIFLFRTMESTPTTLTRCRFPTTASRRSSPLPRCTRACTGTTRSTSEIGTSCQTTIKNSASTTCQKCSNFVAPFARNATQVIMAKYSVLYRHDC